MLSGPKGHICVLLATKKSLDSICYPDPKTYFRFACLVSRVHFESKDFFRSRIQNRSLARKKEIQCKLIFCSKQNKNKPFETGLHYESKDFSEAEFKIEA